MGKYALPVDGSTVSDYRVIDSKRGVYEYIPNPEIRISRNSLETVRAKSIGYTSRKDMTDSRKTYQYKRWYHGSVSDKTPAPLKRAEFEKLYIAARKDDNFNNLAPDSPLAKMLVAVGLRDAEATYSVGSTPSKKPR